MHFFKLTLLCGFTVAAMGLGACAAVEGVGQSVENAGERVQNAAE